MIVPAVSVISIIVFLVAFAATGIVAKCSGAIAVARGALATMTDPSVADLEREDKIQRASITLFGLFFSILIRSLVTLGSAAIPIWVADKLELATAAETLAFLMRWDVIVLSTLIIIVLLATWQRLKNRF